MLPSTAARRTSRTSRRSPSGSRWTRTIVAPAPNAASSALCSAVCTSERVVAAVTVEREPAVVEHRDALGIEPGNAAGDERFDPRDGARGEPRTRRQCHAHAGARVAPRLVGVHAAAGRRDDDARVGDAVDTAQPEREVGRERVARLRFEHRLRRERADVRERLVAAGEVRVRHAGERQPQQKLAALRPLDTHVVARHGIRNVPGCEPLLDLRELVGAQRRREQRDARVA